MTRRIVYTRRYATTSSRTRDDATKRGVIRALCITILSRTSAVGNHARASRIPKRALPHPATWPHRPVFVRFSPRDHGTQRALSGWATRWGPDESAPGSKAPPSAVDLNCPVNTETCMSFESELFVGKIICRFKGIGCPANPSAVKTKEEHFRRKRCTFQVLVQGRFKEAVATHLILTGGEFAKPFTDRPPTYLVSAGCKFFAHLTPGLELDLLCDEPYYVATLGGTVTTLSVDDAEDAPDPTDLEVRENNAKMGASANSDSPCDMIEPTRHQINEDETRQAVSYRRVINRKLWRAYAILEPFCLRRGFAIPRKRISSGKRTRGSGPTRAPPASREESRPSHSGLGVCFRGSRGNGTVLCFG